MSYYVVQSIQKEMMMRNTQAASNLYIPDPDIGGLAISIRSLYVAILTRAIKDIKDILQLFTRANNSRT